MGRYDIDSHEFDYELNSIDQDNKVLIDLQDLQDLIYETEEAYEGFEEDAFGEDDNEYNLVYEEDDEEAAFGSDEDFEEPEDFEELEVFEEPEDFEEDENFNEDDVDYEKDED